MDLLVFLGSQQVDANMFGVEFQVCGVMDYEEAFTLLADTRQAVGKLREQVAAGRGHFDNAVAEWEAGRER